MKRTVLSSTVLASLLCLAGYPTASPAEGGYGRYQSGFPGYSYDPSPSAGIGYRLSGQNQYNLNISRNTQAIRNQTDRVDHRGAYDRPYGGFRGYGDYDYRRSYRHGYRNGYRDAWRYGGGGFYIRLR